MLHYSVRRGHYTASKQLISYGANVNSVDMFNKTPLDYALEIRNFELVQLLLSELANPFREQLYTGNIYYAKWLGKKIYRIVREVQIVSQHF